ncbi:hypothetical protein GCM10027452_03690 [Micromonospora halotolerans]
MDNQRAAGELGPDRVAAEKFAEQLRTLRTGVGNPSFRKMAGRSGRISHTTLHEAAAGTRFPSWETTREFVRACEADEAQWRCRWEDAQRSGTVHAAPDDSPTPVDTDSPTRAGISDAATTRVVAAETSRAVNSAAAGGPVVSGVATSADLVPADLVLVCGVFGNITDADIRATVRHCASLCATGGTVFWTRHRGEPDLVPAICDWFAEEGFTPVAVTSPADRVGVGVHRFNGRPRPLERGAAMFEFIGYDRLTHP